MPNYLGLVLLVLSMAFGGQLLHAHSGLPGNATENRYEHRNRPVVPCRANPCRP